ncbi:MAG: SH3 domain-containing protein [Vicinamibacterales bacterium]
MTGYAATASAFVLALSAIPVHAQERVFTVTTSTASVHSGPSTGSPVIGTATSARTLDVTRELGSWVRVAWPGSPNGGYLHVSWGTLKARSSVASATASAAADDTTTTGSSASASPSPAVPGRAQAAPAASIASTSTTATAPAALVANSSVDARAELAARRAQTQPGARPSQGQATAVGVVSHVIGIGGRMDAPSTGFAASGRIWSSGAIGVQLDLGRTTQVIDSFGPRVHQTTIGANAVYSDRTHVRESVMWRPYFGGGVTVHRATLRLSTGVVTASHQSLGYQVFGGSELSFASAPPLALSADLRREWAPSPFPGFNGGGFGVGLSAHWYVR